MNPKYLVKDEIGEIVLTKQEVARLVTSSDMTEEDYEKAISDYLSEHNARRLYSNDSFDDYQEFTKTTAVYPKEKALEYLSLGLVSEAGEVAGKLKKVIRDGGELDRPAFLKEIGDVLWYCARLTDELEGSLSEITQGNMNKLSSRKERGVLGGSGDDR